MGCAGLSMSFSGNYAGKYQVQIAIVPLDSNSWVDLPVFPPLKMLLLVLRSACLGPPDGHDDANTVRLTPVLKTPLASWGKSRGSAASFLSDRIRCHQPQFPRPNSRARPRERRHRRPPGPAQLAIWLRVHLTRQPRGNRNHSTSMSTARSKP